MASFSKAREHIYIYFRLPWCCINFDARKLLYLDFTAKLKTNEAEVSTFFSVIDRFFNSIFSTFFSFLQRAFHQHFFYNLILVFFPSVFLKKFAAAFRVVGYGQFTSIPFLHYMPSVLSFYHPSLNNMLFVLLLSEYLIID